MKLKELVIDLGVQFNIRKVSAQAMLDETILQAINDGERLYDEDLEYNESYLQANSLLDLFEAAVVKKGAVEILDDIENELKNNKKYQEKLAIIKENEDKVNWGLDI